jgi:hypothetical protein
MIYNKSTVGLAKQRFLILLLSTLQVDVPREMAI